MQACRKDTVIWAISVPNPSLDPPAPAPFASFAVKCLGSTAISARGTTAKKKTARPRSLAPSKILRRSFALPRQIGTEAAEGSPAQLQGNLNRLVTTDGPSLSFSYSLNPMRPSDTLRRAEPPNNIVLPRRSVPLQMPLPPFLHSSTFNFSHPSHSF